MTVIDRYLEEIEPTKRAPLLLVRKIAKAMVPDLEETIAYGMPTLKYMGKAFLGFDAHKNHIGIYPYGGEEIEVFSKELLAQKLKFSAGAIQVPYSQSFPDELLREIIQHRIGRIIKK